GNEVRREQAGEDGDEEKTCWTVAAGGFRPARDQETTDQAGEGDQAERCTEERVQDQPRNVLNAEPPGRLGRRLGLLHLLVLDLAQAQLFALGFPGGEGGALFCSQIALAEFFRSQ